MNRLGLYQGILALFLLASTIFHAGCNEQTIKNKNINIVFRYDDYSPHSPIDLEIRIIDAFRKNKASITFGVIPFIGADDMNDSFASGIVSFGSKKREVLRSALEAGILEVALHGYSHKTNNARQETEFSGLDYPSQLKRLAGGKEFLERMIGVPVTTFIPPWNQYDLNTLRALEDLKFSAISASLSGQATQNSPLKFLPITCDLPGLRYAVKEARGFPDPQPLIVVSFHSYDFKEIDKERGQITYQELYNLLDWLNSQGDIKSLSIAKATTVITDLSANRLLFNKRINSALSLLPSALRQNHEKKYSELANVLLLKAWLRIVLFHLAIVTLAIFVSFMTGRLVFPNSPLITNIAIYGSKFTLVILLIYALYKLPIHYRGMMAIAAAVGACIGTCSCFYYLKKISLCRKDNIS